MSETNIQVWAARANDTSYTLLIDKMVNLGRETDSSGNPFYFDAVWLLPYHTNKTPNANRQDTYTLYDEVIVSTQFIPAPNSAPVGPGATPARITDLAAN